MRVGQATQLPVPAVGLAKIIEKSIPSLQPMAIGALLLFSLWWLMSRYLTVPGVQKQPLPEVSLEIIDGVDRSYSGELSTDPRVAQLMGQIGELRDRAWRTAHDRTGLAIEESGEVVLAFRDAAPAVSGSCREVQSAGQKMILVTLSARQFVAGLIDREATLVHELIHAALRDRMTSEQYFSLPKWFREGVAVWGAGQLRERIEGLLANAFRRNPGPDPLLEELRHPDARDEYLLDAMMFEYVGQNHGDQAVRDVLADVVAGQDLELAFEQHTGFSWERLHWRREIFTEMYVEGALIESAVERFGQTNVAVWEARSDREAPACSLDGRIDAEQQHRLRNLIADWCRRLRQEALTVGVPSNEVMRLSINLGPAGSASSWLAGVCRLAGPGPLAVSF